MGLTVVVVLTISALVRVFNRSIIAASSVIVLIDADTYRIKMQDKYQHNRDKQNLLYADKVPLLVHSTRSS
jgi:hypothetical protein